MNAVELTPLSPHETAAWRWQWARAYPSAAEQTRAVADAYAMLFGVGLVLGAALALWAGRKR